MDGIPHVPVLREEVLAFLDCRPGKVYVDGTVGRAGHSLAILEKSSPDGRLIGLDWDEEALGRAREILAPFGSRVQLWNGNFRDLASFLGASAIAKADGILLDLGVSSEQLESGERGFSFRLDGPLDMRMNQELKIQARDLLRRLPADELARILWEYGEERWARRIARRIVEERKKRPLETTRDLAQIVERSVPFSRSRIHPATRTFQALRIQVNGELESLETFLQTAPKLLNPQGRLAVISFHSLEDRIVKTQFRRWGGRARREETAFRIVTAKPVVPSEEETARNPRARSAKLRVLERIQEEARGG
jgi:16S rRNA (cytosine1402-N4)-methyltransferase